MWPETAPVPHRAPTAREITVLRGQGLGKAAVKAAGKLPPMPTLLAHGNLPAAVHCKGSPSSLPISPALPEQRVTLGDSNLAAKAGELQAGMPRGTREEGIHPPGERSPGDLILAQTSTHTWARQQGRFIPPWTWVNRVSQTSSPLQRHCRCQGGQAGATLRVLLGKRQGHMFPWDKVR